MEAGTITPEVAGAPPLRSRLTTCVDAVATRVDGEPAWNLDGDDQPAVLEMRAGDVLRYSDGLQGEVEDSVRLALVVEHGSDPAHLAWACVDAALTAGGGDNVAVVGVSARGVS